MVVGVASAFTLIVPGAALGGIIVGPANGRPLLVVHGGPGESHDVLRPYLDGLATAERRVVYYDQRGGKRSPLTSDASPGDWKCHVADLEAVRLHFGSAPIDVLGFSWGALLALLYALEEPRHVARLVLVSPPPLHANTNAAIAAAVDAAQARPCVREVAERALRVTSGTQDVATVVHAQFVARVAPFLADPARAWELTPVETREDVARAVWDSLGAYDLRPRLGAAGSMPVLIVGGAQDPVASSTIADTATRLAAQLVVLPDCGHAPFCEAPEAFREVVCRFLTPVA